MRTMSAVALLMAISILALGCGDADSEYRVIVTAQAATTTPAGDGVKPGEPILNFHVAIRLDDTDLPEVTAVSDEDGEATVELDGPGRYRVLARVDVLDSDCVFIGGETVDVEEGATEVLVSDIGLACP